MSEEDDGVTTEDCEGQETPEETHNTPYEGDE